MVSISNTETCSHGQYSTTRSQGNHPGSSAPQSAVGLLGGMAGHERRAGVRPSSSLIQHIVSTLLSVSTHWGVGGVLGVSNEPKVYVHVPNQVPYLTVAGFHSQLFFH